MRRQFDGSALMRLSVVVVLGFSLAGCDYWPPALQSQIEQLRMELQMAAAERTRLENQVKDVVKTRDELQMQVDELTRMNRELSSRVVSLEQTLAAEREKLAKLAKTPKAATKAAAKPTNKATQKKVGKPQPKKKATTPARRAR